MNAGWRANLPALAVWTLLLFGPAVSGLARVGVSPSLMLESGESVFLQLEETAPYLTDALLALGFDGNFFLAIFAFAFLVLFGMALLFLVAHAKQYPGALIIGFFLNLPLFLLSYVVLFLAIYLIDYFSL